MSTTNYRPRSSGHVKITRGHSCFICYRRKVKCDGKRPCATCVKNSCESECRSARPGQLGRLRDAAQPTGNDQALSLRLRRYEELLLAHGIPLDGQGGVDNDESMGDSGTPTIEVGDGHVIIQRGHPRFVDNMIWNRLGNELADELAESSEEDEVVLSGEEASPVPDALVFGRPSFSVPGSSDPTVPQILKMWQIFIENFNPLVKIFHAPTIQRIISEAIADMGCLNASTKALLFAIYLCAITTMTNHECMSQLGVSKMALFRRFSYATQRALVVAQFLKSVDLVVLQALTLYLLASRLYINEQSLWLLTGLARRLAQTMGLHREQSLKHLSQFEAEIRRRLWWQIVIMDNRSAQLSGATVDGGFDDTWDTKRPLNVNDSDLSPFMRELPVEHDGPTDMLFCAIRFEIGECMRQVKTAEKSFRTNHAASVAQKELVINAFEDKLESLLKRCDASIPLHLMSMFLGRSAVRQMRLSVRQPTQEDKGAGMSQEDKDALFQLGLQIMEYDSLTYSTKILQPFLWHVVNNFPFQAFILVLTDLLHRVQGDEVDRAWARVDQAYEDHPELIDDVKNPLYLALGNLTLKAWERRLMAADPKSLITHPITSPAVAKLQSQRASRAGMSSQSVNPDGTYGGVQMTDENRFTFMQSGIDLGNVDLSSLLTDNAYTGWGNW